MRACAQCGKADAPWFEPEPCSCGAAQAHEENPSVEAHAADCNAVGHVVVLYPVRMARSELQFNGAEMVLGAYWRQLGWVLKRNGERWYRVKMLCRGCIEAHDDAQQRRRDYEKACRRARGVEDTTYAQMLAAQ